MRTSYVFVTPSYVGNVINGPHLQPSQIPALSSLSAKSP